MLVLLGGAMVGIAFLASAALVIARQGFRLIRGARTPPFGRDELVVGTRYVFLVETPDGSAREVTAQLIDAPNPSHPRWTALVTAGRAGPYKPNEFFEFDSPAFVFKVADG